MQSFVFSCLCLGVPAQLEFTVVVLCVCACVCVIVHVVGIHIIDFKLQIIIGMEKKTEKRGILSSSIPVFLCYKVGRRYSLFLSFSSLCYQPDC